MADLKQLTRSVAEIESRVTGPQKTVIFRCIDGKGNEGALLDLGGNAADPTDAITLDVPEVAIRPLLEGARTTVLSGGRAAGKSWTIALYLLAVAYSRPVRILAVRDVAGSIDWSLGQLFKDRIRAVPAFAEFFEVQERAIYGPNGSMILYKGLRGDSAYGVLSFEGIDICWTEQAEALSGRSVDLLEPTIRTAGSRLIYSLNPELEEQAIYARYIAQQQSNTVTAHLTYQDNSFITDEVREMADNDRRSDPAKYRWRWEGGLREKGKGQILDHYQIVPDIDLSELPFRTARHIRSYGPIVSKFEKIHGKGSVFCGLDPGHGSSAAHAVFGWFSAQNRTAIILAEYYGEHRSPTEIAAGLDAALPILREKRIPIWVDAAALGTTLTLKERGLNALAATKWPGSVDDGIDRLKSINIQICESCTYTIRDFSLWSWKEDSNGEPTGEPEKKHDHGPDALRYGIWRWIRTGTVSGYSKMKDPYLA